MAKRFDFHPTLSTTLPFHSLVAYSLKFEQDGSLEKITAFVKEALAAEVGVHPSSSSRFGSPMAYAGNMIQGAEHGIEGVRGRSKFLLSFKNVI